MSLGCQNNQQQLETSKLTLISTDENAKTFSANSLEDALKSFLLKLNFQVNYLKN